MFATMFLSGEKVSLDKVAEIMAGNQILCNMTPIKSVVYDKAADEYNVESGVKVDIFEAETHEILDVWSDLRFGLGIHCVWLDVEDYHGCICNWQEYAWVCKECGTAPMTCSEYTDGKSL